VRFSRRGFAVAFGPREVAVPETTHDFSCLGGSRMLLSIEVLIHRVCSIRLTQVGAGVPEFHDCRVCWFGSRTRNSPSTSICVAVTPIRFPFLRGAPSLQARWAAAKASSISTFVANRLPCGVRNSHQHAGAAPRRITVGPFQPQRVKPCNETPCSGS